MNDCTRASGLGYCTHGRRGLSVVEFVGCLVALVGGLALGATFLGLDLQNAAVKLLDEAEIAPPSFLVAAEVPNAPSAQTQDEANSASDNVTTTVPAEVDAPGASIAAPLSEEGASPQDTVQTANVAPAREPTEAEIRVATRKFWDKVVNCMVQEAHARLKPVVADQELQLYDYLLQRKEGHEQAREELESLDTFAVDDRLAAHAQQLIAWHTSGIKLYERVLGLLTDGPSSQIAGPFAQSWQSASTQLRMEESLVLEKHKAVATYLDHTYGEDAPFVPAFSK